MHLYVIVYDKNCERNIHIEKNINVTKALNQNSVYSIENLSILHLFLLQCISKCHSSHLGIVYSCFRLDFVSVVIFCFALFLLMWFFYVLCFCFIIVVDVDIVVFVFIFFLQPCEQCSTFYLENLIKK